MEESAKESLASTTAAIAAGVGGTAGQNVVNAQQKTLPSTVALLSRVEVLIAHVEGIAKSDALKTKGYIEKYWPVAAGTLIALSRLLH